MQVTVVDYGIGNLHSVIKALRHHGAEVRVSSQPADLLSAERAVVPGVGAFADGMHGLQQRGLVEPLHEFARSGRCLLGICLGMQLLLSESDEFGKHRGLDLIPGRVVAIPSGEGVKVPHVGWNRITPAGERGWQSTLLADLSPGAQMYFVHSFTAVPDSPGHRLADTQHGQTVVSAAVQKGNVIGLQFHPEKSGEAGLLIVRRFLSLPASSQS
jgi:glutamine amidotransferase